MLWCFGSAALVMLLLSIAAFTIHPLRFLARVRPLLMLRGCIATSCLLVALALFGVALAATR